MISEFIQLLKKVCEGDEVAWHVLEKHFQDKTITIDEQTQAHLYIKRMGDTYPHAIYIRALLYDRGYGVVQDVEMAFLLMRDAAGRGHIIAIHEVGTRFFKGIGVDQNYERAIEWLKLAAGSPNYYPPAMHQLGMMYTQGLGVTVDPVKAQQWFDKAIAKGYR